MDPHVNKPFGGWIPPPDSIFVNEEKKARLDETFLFPGQQIDTYIIKLADGSTREDIERAGFRVISTEPNVEVRGSRKMIKVATTLGLIVSSKLK
jgi:hypothetical protein